MEIIMLILGAGGGGVIAWLVKSLKVRVQTAELEKELVVSKGRVVELVKQNAELQQKYTDSQSVLANTLSALELLKAYQMIDAETKKQVAEIKETLVDGKASPETMDKYKEMLKKMNENFSGYNKGQKTTTPAATAPTTSTKKRTKK